MLDNQDVISYSAVVLDDESKDKLIKAIASKIPKGWQIKAHHMTIVFGRGLDDKSQIGRDISLVVTQLGFSNKAMAVKAEGYPTNNKTPHITIAVNDAEGGESHHSNDIKDWTDLDMLLDVSGVITEVKK